MAQIRWTHQAAIDLEAIVKFIANDSENYARLMAIDVIKAVERLEAFPNIGRIVPEANNPELREVLAGNYRIIYRNKNDRVEILTIFHCARIMPLERLH